jgi:hypothetical protein
MDAVTRTGNSIYSTASSGRACDFLCRTTCTCFRDSYSVPVWGGSVPFERSVTGPYSYGCEIYNFSSASKICYSRTAHSRNHSCGEMEASQGQGAEDGGGDERGVTFVLMRIEFQALTDIDVLLQQFQCQLYIQLRVPGKARDPDLCADRHLSIDE